MSEARTPIRRVETADRRGLAAAIKGALLGEATEWRLSPTTVAAIALAPLVLLLFGVLTAGLGKGVYKAFVSEDRLAETLQVLSYALALVLCAVVASRLYRADRRGIAALYGVFCAGLVFVIGEELSWGQRALGFGTPGALEPRNRQGETNIHNVYGVEAAFQWGGAAVGAYGGLLPFALRQTRLLAARKAELSWLVPPATLAFYFLPLLVWRIYRNVADPPASMSFVVSEFGEVIELALAFGLAAFAVFQLRRTRSRLGRPLSVSGNRAPRQPRRARSR